MNSATRPRLGSTRRPVPVVLRSGQDVLACLTEWPWRWMSWRSEILLALPGIARPAQQSVERRLNFWRKVCGCLPAALTVLAALVWRGLAIAQMAAWTPGTIIVEIAYVFLLGIAAKLLAVLGARIILYFEIAHLWRRLRALGNGLGE